MQNIYELHDKAFSQVQASVIMKEGEKVATCAFKFPKDGAGRLWCYFHVIGAEMARGYAGGYGYDKRSAAAQSAIGNIEPMVATYPNEQWCTDNAARLNDLIAEFQSIIGAMEGKHWNDALRDAGYTILQAV